VVSAAFANMTFTLDPIASSLQKSAQDAKDAGLLDSTNISGIYDLTQLNQFLQSEGQAPVPGL
jgi:NitT/TauT family transport system substrate-binding protein